MLHTDELWRESGLNVIKLMQKSLSQHPSGHRLRLFSIQGEISAKIDSFLRIPMLVNANEKAYGDTL